jgi:outer membrane protein
VISSPRPYVGADNSILPIPLVELSYKKFYLQGIRAGFHLFEKGDVTLDARARFVFAGLDPDDSPALEGMAERKSSVEGGLALEWRPGKYQLSATAYTDLLGRSGGQQVGLDFSRGWTFARYRWGLTPSIGVVWQSSEIVDYYFGVDPEEARPGRPPFQGQSAFNFRAALLVFFRLTARVNMVGLLRVQRLDNEISSSPIVDKPRGYFGLLGVNYTFGNLRGSPPAR